MKSPGKILAGILFIAFFLSAFVFPAPTFSFYQQSPGASADGAKLYQQRCAACHDNPQDRIPPLFLIRRRSAEDVIQTLTTGSMKQQAAGRTAAQITALAVHLTGKHPGT